MVFYQTYSPPGELKSFIREYQVLHMKWEDDNSLPPPYITCLANTEQNLYFFPHGPIKVLPDANSEGFPIPQIVITGPKNKPVGLKFGKEYLFIKVAFYPTGMYRLLRIPMQPTINNGLDAADFWGDEVRYVFEALKNQIVYEDMLETISTFLLNRYRQGSLKEEPIDRVATQMLDPSMKLSLEEWAFEACLSLRQFERKFTVRVGMAPKAFNRIVRFENAMKVKNSKPDSSWSEIALECGYTDSSHMLREFREFADFPPGSLYQFQTSGYGDFPTG